MAPDRLPFEPLEAVARGRRPRHEGPGCRYCDPMQSGEGTCCTGNKVAMDLGIHPRQMIRWRAVGLTLSQADELAVQLGQHPSVIWPDWDERWPDVDEPPAATRGSSGW